MWMDDRLRSRIQAAFADAGPAHPALRARVIAAVVSAEMGGAGRRLRAAVLGGVALALAAAIVVALVAIRGGSEGDAIPAAAGSPGASLRMEAAPGFSCTLPVLIGDRPATFSLPAGGLTVFPGTRGVPRGMAFVGRRWLPAPLSDVSPDGRSFAYATYTTGAPAQVPDSRVMVEDATSGRVREAWHGSGYAEVLGWTSAGIYFTHQPGGEGLGATEIRLVDPTRPGPGRRVGPNPAFDPIVPPGQLPLFLGPHWLAGGAVWTTYTDQPGGQSNRVARMDLATGSIATWYTAPAGRRVGIAGLDARGLPVLNVFPPDLPFTGTPPPAPPESLLLLTGPDRTVEIAGEGAGQQWYGAFGDDHGTWIMSEDSLWLYAAGRLEKVATLPPGQPTAVLIVGRCA